MAAGDLIVGPSYPQYEWNATGGQILFGSGTDWIVDKASGLLGRPDLKSSDVERQGADGDYPGRNWWKARRVVFDLTIRADTKAIIENYIDSIDSIFQTADVPTQLVFQRTGRSKRFLWAVLERSDFDSTYDVAHMIMKGSVQFKCADPLIYSLVETTTTITIANATTASSATNVANGGDSFNWPHFDIAGPITNPRVANATDGNRQFKLDGTISAGQSLRVDFRNQTAQLWNGSVLTDWSNFIRNDSQWFRLLPGNNSITVSRSASAAASATSFYARDSWGGRRQ